MALSYNPQSLAHPADSSGVKPPISTANFTLKKKRRKKIKMKKSPALITRIDEVLTKKYFSTVAANADELLAVGKAGRGRSVRRFDEKEKRYPRAPGFVEELQLLRSGKKAQRAETLSAPASSSPHERRSAAGGRMHPRIILAPPFLTISGHTAIDAPSFSSISLRVIYIFLFLLCYLLIFFFFQNSFYFSSLVSV